MNLYNSFDQRESYAGPFDLWVAFVEQSKDALMEFRGYSNPIIAYKKNRV